MVTDRLRLQPVTTADTDVLLAMWTDPAVRKYLWDDVVINRGRAAAVVDASVAGAVERGYGLWLVSLRATGQAVGFVGFRPSELGDSDPELLFGLLPAWWHQGLATEAAQAVLRFGFDTLGFDRVVAATDAANEASVRVLERVGLRLVRRGPLHGLDTLFFERRVADDGASVERDAV
jgi:ribosomal-protein-alanine N-acetyltransferase